MSNIHHDLPAIKEVAKAQAKDHGRNYNVIISNPNGKGEFDVNEGSTYEIVADSYFEKPRPNAKLLHTTDDLLKEEALARPCRIKHITN